MVIDEEFPVGNGIQVGGVTHRGLVCLGNGMWLAVEEGQALPTSVQLVQEDTPPPEDVPV